MAIWNGKRFVDALPLTTAAQARSDAHKPTKDHQSCGCDSKPAKSQRTHDALPLSDGLGGYWRITKISK
jgi:hypothetical protein